MNRLPKRAVLDLPELNIAIFTFLLNYVWEILQMVFYEGMAEMAHWEATLNCTEATIGDAGIALFAFWGIAWRSGSGRRWPLCPTRAQVAGFSGIGVMITIILENLYTGVLNRFSYGALMPVIPLLEVGLLPFLQWVILPPITVWFVNRQLT